MAKTNLPLRAELDGVWYLDAHPEVAEHFKTAGVYRYCEKLTSFHRQVAEIFAQGYNGRTVKIGPEEFHIDEAAIADCTGLPRTGEYWFKTTHSTDVEFRSYLLPAHSGITWKKDIPAAFLEPKWRALLKAIKAYITCEGRYHRVMFYHFKLLNHFTGREVINLPHYLHKTLEKMSKQVQDKPTKLATRLSHPGLITLLIKELLRRRGIEWNTFLFWNEFQTEVAQEEAAKPLKGKKGITPKSSKRKRRAITPPTQEEQPSTSKRRRSKRKLSFSQTKIVPQGKNPLNLPYSESESDNEQPQEAEQQEQDVGQQVEITEVEEVPPSAGPSTEPSSPKRSKVNMLLQELFRSKDNEKQTKIHNSHLIQRNMKLYDRSQEIIALHNKTIERNGRLMRENAKLYRQLRLLKLDKRGSAEHEEPQQAGLDTLAAIATIFEEDKHEDFPNEQVRRSSRLRGTHPKRA